MNKFFGGQRVRACIDLRPTNGDFVCLEKKIPAGTAGTILNENAVGGIDVKFDNGYRKSNTQPTVLKPISPLEQLAEVMNETL